jgi:hypothetical protein
MSMILYILGQFGILTMLQVLISSVLVIVVVTIILKRS